jgi:hypothetical protein
MFVLCARDDSMAGRNQRDMLDLISCHSSRRLPAHLLPDVLRYPRKNCRSFGECLGRLFLRKSSLIPYSISRRIFSCKA